MDVAPDQAYLESERKFHNDRFAEGDSRESQLKYYWAIWRGAHAYMHEVNRLAVGADVLEYGCGAGENATRLGHVAKSVSAIDISDVAIERARQACPHENVSYQVMDAMNLEFPDNSFDLVFGSGIVHHLDVERCAAEVSRVLRPSKPALFWEPLGINPIINSYRMMTPSARTVDEHPLLPRDFEILRRHFSSVDVQFYGLTTLGAVPFERRRFGKPLMRTLEWVDNKLLALPGVRWLAWYSLIRCTK